MPSYPDYDVEAPVRVPTARPPEDLLALIKAEGRRRRARRHRRNGVFAAFGLVLLALPLITLLPGDDGDDEDITVAAENDREPTTTETTARRRTTTTVVSTETTIGEAVIVAPDTIVLEPETESESDDEVGLAPATSVVRRPPPTGPSPTTTAPPATTTPPPSCVNSRDPACGEFRWEPQPSANQPLSVQFINPGTIVEDQPVSFTVAWSDGDATLSFANFAVDGGALLSQACTQEQRFGPWTPPAPNGGSGNVTSNSFTFSEPGDHVVSVLVSTADCNNPYASEATREMVVTVQPAA